MSGNELTSSIKQNSPTEKLSSKIESLEVALITLKKGVEIAVNEVKNVKKQYNKILSKQQKKKKRTLNINHMDLQFLQKYQMNYVFLWGVNLNLSLLEQKLLKD